MVKFAKEKIMRNLTIPVDPSTYMHMAIWVDRLIPNLFNATICFFKKKLQTNAAN